MIPDVSQIILGIALFLIGIGILRITRSGRIVFLSLLLLAIGVYVVMLGLGFVTLPAFLGGNATTTMTNSTSTT